MPRARDAIIGRSSGARATALIALFTDIVAVGVEARRAVVDAIKRVEVGVQRVIAWAARAVGGGELARGAPVEENEGGAA